MGYVVIVENDISEWDDVTGHQYHFPKRYLKNIEIGDRIIYYKGKRQASFKGIRQMEKPHYFGVASVQGIKEDEKTRKHYYAYLQDYFPFVQPVPAKIGGKYLEPGAEDRKNYFRQNSVRPISEEVFFRILNYSETDILTTDNSSNDLEDNYTSIQTEGKKKLIYTYKYERNKKLRDEAIRRQGLTCRVCEINFESKYGEWGKGFIHVHHIKPLHSFEEETIVNPGSDLVVVCPNCHAMIHRKKNNVLTVAELRKFLGKV